MPYLRATFNVDRIAHLLLTASTLTPRDSTRGWRFDEPVRGPVRKAMANEIEDYLFFFHWQIQISDVRGRGYAHIQSF